SDGGRDGRRRALGGRCPGRTGGPSRTDLWRTSWRTVVASGLRTKGRVVDGRTDPVWWKPPTGVVAFPTGPTLRVELASNGSGRTEPTSSTGNVHGSKSHHSGAGSPWHRASIWTTATKRSARRTTCSAT